MPQPWYGQHPLVASGQTAAGVMHHQRYHAGGSGQGGGNATTFAAHRGSPTVNRPPSSASTSSTGSYIMHSGPVSTPQPQETTAKLHSQGHSMNMGPVPHSVIGSHGNMHHASMPHHAPAERYPMPPRNPTGSVYLTHSAPGAHIPIRSHHGTAPPMHAQPLRQLAGGNTVPTRDQHDGATSAVPSQYGSTKSPQLGSMPRQGNASVVHHSMSYTNHQGMRAIHAQPSHHYQHHQYHHQGYYHNSRRSSYPPTTPHHTVGAQEGNYAHYQRPVYESPETVVDYGALSRSPSPPPAPTAFPRDGTCEAAGPLSSATSATGSTDRRVLGEATFFKSIGNNPQHSNSDAQRALDQQRNESPHSNAPSKATVNEDDDAASILLQLSGVPSQAPSQDASKSVDEGRPLSTVHTNNQGSFASHSTSNLLKPIEASPSLDDDATIATAEGADFAPELTSEPSADSIDQHDSEFPAPIPENYPTRLALKYDDRKLNSLHCFLRSELLEIFVVQKSSHKSPTHSPGSSVGRVGLRCVHCAMIQRNKENREEAPMAVFYPKSISEIYRLVTSWQRCHLRKCRNLPPAIRAKWQSLRDNDKSRGKTHYWITSAKEIGLVDCQSRAGGIRFGPNTKCTEAKQIEVPNTVEGDAAIESTNESTTPAAPLSESTSMGVTLADKECTASV